MNDQPYLGNEPVSFLRYASTLVQAEIARRHERHHGFISTYGFPGSGLWWLLQMQAVLNQVMVTALFGLVEATAREHLRNALPGSGEPHGWGQVRPKFEKAFKCHFEQVAGFSAVTRARLLANYFKHTGATSLHALVENWPVCGTIVNDPQRGALYMWAGIPVDDLAVGVEEFLKALQAMVDAAPSSGTQGVSTS